MTNNKLTALRSILEADFNAEAEKAKRCCEQCHQRFINSEIYYKYGYEAATNRLIGILERAVEVLSFYANGASYGHLNGECSDKCDDSGRLAEKFLAELLQAETATQKERLEACEARLRGFGGEDNG